MNRKKKGLTRRILAAVMSVCVLMCSINITAFAAEDINNYNRQTDPSTINSWESLFINSDAQGVDFTTENAGGVWTDKSVFKPSEIPAELTDATSLENTHLSITDTNDNFLVALSAIASNKEIVGYSTIPTDTVFVLDLSSSMRTSGDNRTSAIDDLVDATNKAITDLLALNKNNRVAVVMYAGNVNGNFSSADGTTVVLMPLDTYTPATTTNGVGQYLQSTSYSGNRDWAIKIRDGVRNSQGGISGTKNTGTGTYMQDGVYEAMKVLLSADTTIASGVQAGVDRKPIMLIMTDGEPTLANNDYDGNDALTNLGNSVMYDYNGYNNSYNHRDSIAFMTMLTTAFAKKQIERHYDTEALFYTLAYGEQVNTLDEAISVMNPEKTATALNRFWTPFLSGERVEVYRSGNTRLYTQNSNDSNKKLTAEDKLYVDEFFPANTDAQLATAFEQIVEQIKIQSKYYPTYVETDHDHDGYITFTDKIGGYMEVKGIKGFVIGNHYFSGATLSKGFTEENSIFGTIENPNALGDNFVWSVKERLGIVDTTIARQLIQNAFDNKQLSYTNNTEFSNYIGWYSDKDGNYLDFWHEGLDVGNAPANATHIIKSYGFLGETDEVHGISNTDMLYASVRVSTELDDYDNDGIAGETMLTWQLPASLIPTITYNVDVDIDSDGNIIGVRNVEIENENVKPIRLLYEVALRSDIYDWNVAEKVNDGYKNSTSNKDAGYVFYTNQWKKPTDSNDTSYKTDTTRNTYSHFEPSTENERYYYTENSIIYTDKNGTEYTGNQSTPPNVNGTYYRSFKVYEKMDNGTFRMHTHYEQISKAALSELTAGNNYVNGNWVIRKGVIHRYLDDYYSEKAPNTTNTHKYVEFPSVVEDSSNHHYYTYDTLGNNGKLTVTPATGIKVTKTLEEAVDGATNNFEFKISGGSGNAILVRVDRNGNETSRTTFTFVNGEATFNLAADETVYIIGLQNSVQYTISEAAHEEYRLVSVAVNGIVTTGDTAVITVADQTIQTADFVNGSKKYGNLYITKEIVSDHEIPQAILAQQFELQIKVDAVGEYDVIYSGSSGTLKAQVDANGYLKVNNENLKISAEQTYEILNLPEGTKVEVEEILSASQKYFKAEIKTRDYTGATQDNDGVVTITRNANSTAVIRNTYTPASVKADLDISGTKIFTVETPLADELTFNFVVQKYDEVTKQWNNISNKSASVKTKGTSTGDSKTFEILDVLSGETYDKVGDYAYQVIEVIPDNKANGVTYDRTLYTFTVHVTDNNGQLEANIVSHLGDEITQGVYNVVFRNTYHTAPVSIDVKKAITNLSGNPAITAAGFTFEAVETDSNWNPKANGEVFTETTDGAGEARFTKTFDKADNYYYIITENIPNGAVEITQGTHAGMKVLNGWIYDTTAYYVKVTVTEQNDGNLVATVQVSQDQNNLSGSTDSASVAFSNIYDPTDAVLSLNRFVSKELKGRVLKVGEFTFHVTENGKSYAASAGDRRLVGTNDANGNVSFDKSLVFDRVGRYEFDITEVIPDGTNKLGGVTYDNTTYDLVVEVVDNNGILEALAYFEDSVSTKVTFHNTYDASGEATISGTKTLSGRAMVNGEFHFTLTEVTDATGATVVQNGISLRAENGPDDDNDGKAKFEFSSIKYTLDDVGETFYYLVEEVNAGKTINGVKHDDQKYIVTIKVTDNGDGTLKAAVTYKVGTADAGEIAYNNTYIPQSVKVNLHALKVLEGRDLRANEFSFSIKQTEGDYTTSVSGGISEVVANDKNGVVHFSEIELKAAGAYCFVVQEVVGNVNGISYDDTKYHVQVTVTDNGSGILAANTSIVMVKADSTGGQGAVVETSVSSMIFNNVYNTPDISIEKKQAVGENKTLADATGENLTVKAGDVVTYYLEVKNNGEGYAKNITITDVVPKGLTLVKDSISANGTEKDRVITWEINELPADAAVVVGFSVKVPEVEESTEWKNVGVVKYYEPDDTPGTDTPEEHSSNEVVIEELQPKLQAVKKQAVNGGTASTEKQVVKAGDKVTYYITITNSGKLTAKGISLTDKLPAGLEVVGGTISDKGVMKDGTISWTIDSLAVGASVTVSFSVTVPSIDKDSTWTNVATVVYENHPNNPDDADEPKTPESSNEVTVEEKAVVVSAPKTGDNASIAVWSTFAFASLMVCGALLVIEKKRKGEI